MSYIAPIKDMLFVMQHLANIEAVSALPGFQDHGLDTARAVLEEQSHLCASAIGATVNCTSVRDTKTRWGSCSPNGNLSYSWRLIFAPSSVSHYVCCHEVAHLLEMNHSPKFWKVVEGLCPDYKKQRQWLRANSSTLFRYG